jgi:hypothetical protein
MSGPGLFCGVQVYIAEVTAHTILLGTFTRYDSSLVTSAKQHISSSFTSALRLAIFPTVAVSDCAADHIASCTIAKILRNVSHEVLPTRGIDLPVRENLANTKFLSTDLTAESSNSNITSVIAITIKFGSY